MTDKSELAHFYGERSASAKRQMHTTVKIDGKMYFLVTEYDPETGESRIIRETPADGYKA